MNPSHEDLSCTVNVKEVGRQARAELGIMEKEKRALNFHGLIKFLKQT